MILMNSTFFKLYALCAMRCSDQTWMEFRGVSFCVMARCGRPWPRKPAGKAPEITRQGPEFASLHKATSAGSPWPHLQPLFNFNSSLTHELIQFDSLSVVPHIMFDSCLLVVQASKLRRGPQWIAIKLCNCDISVTVGLGYLGWGPEDVPVPDSDLEAHPVLLKNPQGDCFPCRKNQPKEKPWKQPGPKWCTELNRMMAGCIFWQTKYVVSWCILLSFNDKLRAFGLLESAGPCQKQHRCIEGKLQLDVTCSIGKDHQVKDNGLSRGQRKRLQRLGLSWVCNVHSVVVFGDDQSIKGCIQSILLGHT